MLKSDARPLRHYSYELGFEKNILGDNWDRLRHGPKSDKLAFEALETHETVKAAKAALKKN